jgi:hypothetical protein
MFSKTARPILDGIDDAGEVVVQQHHIGCLLGHVRAHDAHGDADVSSLQRRGIVDAVARNCHDMLLLLQRLHDAHLLVNGDPREDVFSCRVNAAKRLVRRSVLTASDVELLTD